MVAIVDGHRVFPGNLIENLGFLARVLEVVDPTTLIVEDYRGNERWLADPSKCTYWHTQQSTTWGPTYNLAKGVWDTRCGDCGRETNHQKCRQTQWYMVNDEVWEQANAQRPRRFLCIGCLETRLGRQLGPQDFPAYPINELECYADDTLRSRQGR